MKRIIGLILLIASVTSVNAQKKDGVQFFKGTWAELLATAQKQKKPIFVDVFAEWCGPCKTMNLSVFPTKEMGDKYNAAFINYKLDAENGEGPELAQKYGIRAYPSFLYLDASGNLVQKLMGARPATDMNRYADTALKKLRRS